MASAKLMKGIASGNLKIRKLVAGEVMVKFQNEKYKPIFIGHGFIVDIFNARESLSKEDVKHSNLAELESHNRIEIL